MADATIRFEGMDPIDLESVQNSSPQEFILVMADNSQVPALYRKSVDGQRIEAAELVVSGRTIGLHDIYITSASISDQTWALTLQADRVDYS